MRLVPQRVLLAFVLSFAAATMSFALSDCSISCSEASACTKQCLLNGEPSVCEEYGCCQPIWYNTGTETIGRYCWYHEERMWWQGWITYEVHWANQITGCGPQTMTQCYSAPQGHGAWATETECCAAQGCYGATHC